MPFSIQMNLTREDLAEATLAAVRGEMARSRRQILTRGLMVVVASFLVLMGFSTGFQPAAFVTRMWGMPLAYLLLCVFPIVLMWALQPRLALRSMRTMLREAGVRDSWSVTLRISEEGLTSTEPDRTLFIPWHRFRGLVKTPRLLVFAQWPYEGIPLPRHLIPPDARPSLIPWFADKIAAPAPQTVPEDPPPPADAVCVTTTLTPEDYADMLLWQRDQPAARRRTLRNYVVFWALASLLLPVFILLLILFDPQPIELDRVLWLAQRMVPDLIRNTLVLAAGTAFFYVLRRRMAARTLRKLAERNAELFDPLPLTLIFEPGGITARQGGTMSHYGWPMVLMLSQTLSHVLLPLRSYGVLAFRVEELDAPALKRVKDMARAAGVPVPDE